MTKTFRLRISRVLKSSFQSCRSKHPSSFPTDPVPSFFRLPPVDPNLITLDFPTTHPPPPPSSTKHHQPHRPSFKRHVSSAFISLACGCGSKSDRRTIPQEFQWQKEEEEWHIVAKVCGESDSSPRQKIYNSAVSGDSDYDILAPASPPPPPPTAEKKKKRRSKKKKATGKHRTSTSSADSGLLSSEEREREETETLVSSSRSFSRDSSTEFNPHLETIREKPNNFKRRNQKKKAKKAAAKHGVSKGTFRTSVSSATECESSAFNNLIPWAVEGKVRESLAVVKKSEDPYEDFKRSMMDMICEKQMFEERELEQLLQCFLSLNSRQHHGAIVEAFSEIWHALFSPTTSSQSFE